MLYIYRFVTYFISVQTQFKNEESDEVILFPLPN